MKIINKEYYRSTPMVNITDDLVRITVTATRYELRCLERFIEEQFNTINKQCTCAPNKPPHRCEVHGFMGGLKEG